MTNAAIQYNKITRNSELKWEQLFTHVQFSPGNIAMRLQTYIVHNTVIKWQWLQAEFVTEISNVAVASSHVPGQAAGSARVDGPADIRRRQIISWFAGLAPERTTAPAGRSLVLVELLNASLWYSREDSGLGRCTSKRFISHEVIDNVSICIAHHRRTFLTR